MPTSVATVLLSRWINALYGMLIRYTFWHFNPSFWFIPHRQSSLPETWPTENSIHSESRKVSGATFDLSKRDYKKKIQWRIFFLKNEPRFREEIWGPNRTRLKFENKLRKYYFPKASNHSLYQMQLFLFFFFYNRFLDFKQAFYFLEVEFQQSWGKLRRKPAIRWFGESFAPMPRFDERFARQ